MNERKRFLLERAIDGRLTPDEREEFESLVQNDAAFARQVERERQMHRMAADAAPQSFGDHFAHRVMKRVRTAADVLPFEVAMMALLRRLAPMPLAAAGVLASYNAYVGTKYLGAGASFVEVLFGLPPITIDTLLGL
jgi:anti-sigma factor RsiW